MDLAPGNWLLSPDGELIYIWHTLADGESFADHADTVDRIIRPDDDKHARLLRARFTGDEAATDYLLGSQRPSDARRLHHHAHRSATRCVLLGRKRTEGKALRALPS